MTACDPVLVLWLLWAHHPALKGCAETCNEEESTRPTVLCVKFCCLRNSPPSLVAMSTAVSGKASPGAALSCSELVLVNVCPGARIRSNSRAQRKLKAVEQLLPDDPPAASRPLFIRESSENGFRKSTCSCPLFPSDSCLIQMFSRLWPVVSQAWSQCQL